MCPSLLQNQNQDDKKAYICPTRNRKKRGKRGWYPNNLTPSTWHQTPMTFDVDRHFSRQTYQHPTTHYRQETLTLPPPYKGNMTNWVQENNEGSHLIILCWQILHTVYRMFFNTESNKNSLLSVRNSKVVHASPSYPLTMVSWYTLLMGSQVQQNIVEGYNDVENWGCTVSAF